MQNYHYYYYYYCYECSPGETYRPKQFHMTNNNLFFHSLSNDWIYLCMRVCMSRTNVCSLCICLCKLGFWGVMILGIHLNSRHLHFKFKILPFVFSLVLKFMYICCSSTQQKWVAFDLAQIRTKFSQTHSHTERRTTNHLKQRTHINSLEYTYTWNLYSE